MKSKKEDDNEPWSMRAVLNKGCRKRIKKMQAKFLMQDKKITADEALIQLIINSPE